MPLFHIISARDRQRLVAAIHTAEHATSGEIRVHVQRRCSADPMRDATRVFERLGMNHTADRNGVLIFLARSSRRFAVIGDTGIHQHVDESFWQQIADAMTPHFKSGDFAAGLEAGVLAIGDALKRHFPHRKNDINELPDTISEG